MKGEVQPQDAKSGLVERLWTRERGLKLRTLEGRKVKAKFLDPEGRLQQATGKVARNARRRPGDQDRVKEGEWREFVVTRDANVDVLGRKPSR